MADQATQNLIDAGIIVIAAAGNQNEDSCNRSPARVPGVIAVGAMGQGDVRSHTSNIGACIDIWAPGMQILGAGVASDTAIVTKSGTSMAAPMVTGALALYLSAGWTIDNLLADAEYVPALADETTTGRLLSLRKLVSGETRSPTVAPTFLSTNAPTRSIPLSTRAPVVPSTPTNPPFSGGVPAGGSGAKKPTEYPTFAPLPTRSPTMRPNPTAAPSLSVMPSKNPTLNPTHSAQPTHSVAPSNVPTTSPAPSLSASPSVSSVPSSSVDPTAFPSTSLSPSSLPTASMAPTRTATPTDKFIEIPLAGGGGGDSDAFSAAPTMTPTKLPTHLPVAAAAITTAVDVAAVPSSSTRVTLSLTVSFFVVWGIAMI